MISRLFLPRRVSHVLQVGLRNARKFGDQWPINTKPHSTSSGISRKAISCGLGSSYQLSANTRSSGALPLNVRVFSSHKTADTETQCSNSSNENFNNESMNLLVQADSTTSPESLNAEEEILPEGHTHVHSYEINADGYLSIADLVKFLQFEAAMDICVIKTCGFRSVYVDYFVVVSGMSTRHLRAMAKNLEQLFRGYETRGVGKHGHVTIEGLESNHWMTVDIGNMVVHFFLPEVREVYELEKLWTLGPKYDDQYKAMLEEEEFLQAVYLGEGLDNPQITDDEEISDSV